MSKTIASFTLDHPVDDAPKIKTLDWRLAGTSRDLEARIKHAFDLAKSSGLELNLAISSEDANASTMKQPRMS